MLNQRCTEKLEYPSTIQEEIEEFHLNKRMFLDYASLDL